MLNSNLLRKLDMQDLMVFVAVYEQSSVTGVSEALCQPVHGELLPEKAADQF